MATVRLDDYELNRISVIGEEGRMLEVWNTWIDFSVQDYGKTLKIFLVPRALHKETGGGIVALGKVIEMGCGGGWYNGQKLRT